MPSLTFCQLRRGLLFLLILQYLNTYFHQFALGDSFDDKINRSLQLLKIRGAAVVFFDKGKMSKPIVRGYGKAATSRNSPAVDADTAFMIASLSKVFTASAVAVLLDKGLISSLDDDICNVIPTFWKQSACRNPNYPNVKVTWRMMMTHRSSMETISPDRTVPEIRDSKGKSINPLFGPSGTSFTFIPDAAGNPSCPLEDVIGFYRDILTEKPTETSIGNMTLLGGEQLNWYNISKGFPDGSMWTKIRPGNETLYSNFAVGYLPALIQLLTGQDFPSFTKENIFTKLNMNNTAWFTRDLPEKTKRFTPIQYRLFRYWKDIGEYCFILYGAGQLYTTANDLAKWGDIMLQYGAPTLWSESTGRKVVSCQAHDDQGQEIQGKCGFGMGWVLLNDHVTEAYPSSWMEAFKVYDWTDAVWHRGDTEGAQSMGIVLPKAGIYLFVMTNTISYLPNAIDKLTEQVHKAASSL